MEEIAPTVPDEMKNLDAWFMQEVIPLEAYLMAYLRSHWKQADDWADLRQEVYMRVYAAAQKGFPRQLKAFMVAVARNTIIDRTRRWNVVPMRALTPLDEHSMAVDEPAADESLISQQALSRVMGAIESLPPRCREVVEFRRFQGLSQRETAQRMKVTEDTVERQMAKAMRRLTDCLLDPGETEL